MWAVKAITLLRPSTQRLREETYRVKKYRIKNCEIHNELTGLFFIKIAKMVKWSHSHVVTLAFDSWSKRVQPRVSHVRCDRPISQNTHCPIKLRLCKRCHTIVYKTTLNQCCWHWFITFFSLMLSAHITHTWLLRLKTSLTGFANGNFGVGRTVAEMILEPIVCSFPPSFWASLNPFSLSLNTLWSVL